VSRAGTDLLLRLLILKFDKFEKTASSTAGRSNGKESVFQIPLERDRR
jgi:hypothetical protein